GTAGRRIARVQGISPDSGMGRERYPRAAPNECQGDSRGSAPSPAFSHGQRFSVVRNVNGVRNGTYLRMRGGRADSSEQRTNSRCSANADTQKTGTEKQKALRSFERRASFTPGGDLLSHTVSRAVPSALEGLTALFGMGRGVTPPP